MQAQHGRGVAGADLVGNGAAGRLGLRSERADFEVQTDGHVIVRKDLGLDFELDAHVLVADGFRDEARRTWRGRCRDDRNLVTNEDLGLLAAARAQLGVGERLHVTNLALRVDRRCTQSHADVVAVERKAPQRGVRAPRQRQWCQADRSRQTHPQFREAIGTDFQHFGFNQNLGVRVVEQGDQPFGELDVFEAVAQHEQVMAIVNKRVAQLH